MYGTLRPERTRRLAPGAKTQGSVSSGADRVKIAIAPGYGQSPSETGELLIDNVALRDESRHDLIVNGDFTAVVMPCRL